MNKKELLEEYTNKKDAYLRLSSVVYDILKNEFDKHGIKYMGSFRSKDLYKLSEKIDRKTYGELSKYTDLAGVRFIFYLREDVRKAQEILLNGLFQLANGEDYGYKDNNAGYKAWHYIIGLGEERSKLPEYVELKEFLCEIQFTTVSLHHRSEIEHDVIYKCDKKIEEKYPYEFKKLKEKFSKIMKEKIESIDHEFTAIKRDYDRLNNGLGLLGLKDIVHLKKEKSNSLIITSLGDIKKNILIDHTYSKELYTTSLSEGLNVWEELKSMLKNSVMNDEENKETYFGEYESIGYNEVVRSVFDFYEAIWKIDTSLSVKFLFDIYGFVNDSRELFFEVLKSISEYDRALIQYEGYNVQSMIIKYSEMFGEAEMIGVYGNLLRPSIDRFVTDLEQSKITPFNATLKVHEDLISIRNSSFEALFQIFNEQETLFKDKKEILRIVYDSVRLDNRFAREDHQELFGLLKEDAKVVITFYDSIIQEGSFALVEDTERYIDRLVNYYYDDDEILKLLDQLKKKIEQKDGWDDYKLFSQRAYMDQVHIHGYESQKQYCEEKMTEFVSQFSEVKFQFIKYLIDELKSDYNGIVDNMIGFFFTKYAEVYGISVLETIHENQRENYLYRALYGLWSKHKESAKEEIMNYIENKAHMNQVLKFMIDIHVNDEDIFTLLSQVVKDLDDTHSITLYIEYLMVIYNETLEEELVWSIDRLTSKEVPLKIEGWRRQEIQDLLDSLSESVIDSILHNFLLVKRIDHDLDSVLGKIAAKYPVAVMNFLFERISREKDALQRDGYDAIGYDQYWLKEGLKGHRDIFRTQYQIWYKNAEEEKRWKYMWEGARLFHEVFPVIKDQLEFFYRIVEQGSRIEVELLLYILDKYDGSTDLYPVLREILVKYDQDEEIEKDIDLVMWHSGVVGGERGLEKLYKERADLLEKTRLTDSNEKVREFAKEKISEWRSYSASLKARNDEKIALRKNEFGNL